MVKHIVSGWSKIAQAQKKRRHDTVAKAEHWDLSRQYMGGKRFEYALGSVLENDEAKTLWDFAIWNNRKLMHNRFDVVMIDKKTSECDQPLELKKIRSKVIVIIMAIIIIKTIITTLIIILILIIIIIIIIITTISN